ncbi:MAG: hypothetical protein PHH69_00830 [Candidatus Omnitrophica bacterium]|nr:hypothetical protein [Candidatus Omnitrophota bacterium]
MQKEDYIYTDKTGYKVHIVSLVPDAPKRLLLIPPLVGATGTLAIKTFRYFFREGCILMSFDYCGHYKEIDNKFTLRGTFSDTKIVLAHAFEYAKKINIPFHVVGACYGLIPLIYVLNELSWPIEIKSMFSVSGLLNIDEILNFNDYKIYLEKKNLFFKNKEDFINFIFTNKKDFIIDKQKYMDALTEYLLKVFAELADTISYKSFGVLEYAKTQFYETFYEFTTINLPEIKIPRQLPCLFFLGKQDTILNLQLKESNAEYLRKINRIAPHAKLCNIKIDHFGRGEDHYIIGKEGMKFLIANDGRA